MHPPRPILRSAISTALAAVLTLAICAFLHSRIPPQWLNTTPTTVPLGYAPYLAPPNDTVTYLQASATFTPRGLGLATGITVAIQFDDRPHPDIPAGKNVFDTREEALQHLTLDYPAACNAAQYPEAALLFDAPSLRAPHTHGGLKETNTATLNYPERRPAAIFMAVRPFALVAAWLVLAITAPFIAIAAVRARAARAIDPTPCKGCGYDLSGTAQAVRCPECGLDLIADRDARRRTAGRARRITGWSLLILSLLLGVVWAHSFFNADLPTVLFSHKEKDGISGFGAALAKGGLHVHSADYSRFLSPYTGTNLVLSSPPAALFADPHPLPDDPSTTWQIWYAADYAARQDRWLALWPFAATAAAAGLCLISVGAAARRIAQAPTPIPPQATTQRSFRRTYARFLLHWFILTALITLAALTPALVPDTQSWVDDFARTSKGVLYVASDYANNGAEAKVSSSTRSSPVLFTRTTNVTWFPSQPDINELATAYQVNSRSRSNIPVRDPSLLFLPPGTRTDFAPQPGLAITALCALLLVHPTREYLAARKHRRANA